MKYTKTIYKALVLTFILSLLYSESYGQKKLEKSGPKPNWVNWSRGKDFKSLKKGRGKKIKTNRDEDVYLFVAFARETAFKDGNTIFTLDDAKRSAGLNASFTIASIIKQEVDAAVSSSTRIINEDERARIFERTEAMKTAATFTGFTQVGSYWEKVADKENDKQYYDVALLFSMSKPFLMDNVNRVAEKLELPEEDAANVMSQILTAGDDADLGDF